MKRPGVPFMQQDTVIGRKTVPAPVDTGPVRE
jgi:hypothetical protein